MRAFHQNHVAASNSEIDCFMVKNHPPIRLTNGTKKEKSIIRTITMKLSLNWLSEQLDLSDYTIDELSDLLTFAGVEVEGIERTGVPTDLVVVAEVKEKSPHPDADKLNVCQVDAGEGELRQIVCGAKNYKAGDKVPCALPGADLGGGFVIKEGKLRGVASNGMLCGAGEIGLTDEEDGLMILPSDYELGKQMTSLYSGDTIFELEITPNRPDCLSHSGMARELGAIIGQAPKPIPHETVANKTKVATTEEIAIEDTDACSYYTATQITGVKVAPSPEWLVEKLEAIGLAPINNVVDITNYVLHETGQPLHAFDASKVGKLLKIRTSQKDELFTGLDDKEYSLHDDDCVIVVETGKALALAGVLGGLDSGVTDSTTDIILEAAYFTPSRVRRTARRQGNLTTDSSYRFERGVDFESIDKARDLAIALIKSIAKGAPEETLVSGSIPESLPTIELPERLLTQVSGGDLSMETAEKHLRALGLTYIKDNNKVYWGIPAFRQDLTRPIDLIEEVVRLEGFDNITSGTRSAASLPSKEDIAYDGQFALKRQLVGLGFYEANTIKLISEKELSYALPIKPLLDGDVIKVALPLSEEHSTMRPSLIPGLLSSATRNARQGAQTFRFFEIDRTFRNAGGGKAKDLESDHLGILMGGQRTPKGWNSTEEICDAFDLKGVLQALAPNGEISLKPRDRDGFLLGAEIHLDGKNIGSFAQLSPHMQREFDFPTPIYLAELDVNKLVSLRQSPRMANELSKFPGSSRDVALECPLTVSAGNIAETLKKQNQPLLVNFTCFDHFHDASGEKLPADKKSLAFRLDYRSEEKNLKAKEVEEAHETLVKTLCDKLGLVQR